MINQLMTPLEPSEGDMSSLPQPDSGLARAILDSIPARVAVLDRELRYIYGNRSLLQFLGVSKTGIIGRNVVDVLGEEAFEEFKPYVTRALSGETVSRNDWITYPGSRDRYVQQVITPYRACDRTIAGLFIFTRDLTDLSLPQIGRLYGGRDHTTVLNSLRRIEAGLDEDPELAEKIRELRGAIHNPVGDER